MARIRLATIPTTTTPAAGEVSIYAKGDNNLYLQDSSGLEKLLIDSESNASAYKVEYITLTIGEIITGQIVLAALPADANRVLVTPYQGIPCFFGLDFTVAGNVLSWTGLGLDGLLEPGDILQVIYVT